MPTPTQWLAKYQVNVGTAQSGTQSAPKVVALGNGDFLVAWVEAADGSIEVGAGAGIIGRIYDAEGNLVKDTFVLNSVTSGNEAQFDVDSYGAGGFRLIYVSESIAAPDESTVYTQIYSSSYTTSGSLTVETEADPDIFFRDPSIASHSNSLATIASYTIEDHGESSIRGQYSGGTSAGPLRDYAVNAAGVAEEHSDVAVLAFSPGGVGIYVSVYQSDNGIKFDLFNDSLSVSGYSAAISGQAISSGLNIQPVVAGLADGGFVIAWTANDTENSNVEYQVYNFDGTARSGVLTAAGGTNVQDEPVIVALPDGDFAIAWDDDTAKQLQVAVFDGANGAKGTETTIENALDGPGQPEIDVTSDGRLLFTWIAENGGGEVFSSIWDPRSSTIVGLDFPTGNRAILQGTTFTTGLGDTILSGTASANLMLGQGGNDTIDGIGGNDTIYGGDGNDTLIGGLGTDNLFGEEGNDILRGSTDNMDGGSGFDTADFSDALSLFTVDGPGNTHSGGFDLISMERVLGSNSFAVTDNILLGGTLVEGFGQNGDDTITGSGANEVLNGGQGDDILSGGAGNDTLDGGMGADSMAGGADNDTYFVDNVGDSVVEYAGEGTDTVNSSISFALFEHSQHIENLVLTGTDNIDGSGNGLDNTITGNSGNNVLNGGFGADTMIGGLGDDTYKVENAGDMVVENAGEGTDTVQSSITVALYTYGQHIENLTLTGTANIDGSGNGLDNTITGNWGNNVLNGGFGADTMIGGGGNDTYKVENAGDVVVENAGQGIDTVQASISYVLTGHVEALQLTGSANIDGTGNGLANTLTGNSGNNYLNGGGGADTMIGGLGNDTYRVDNAGDSVVENAGEGTDLVESWVSFELFNYSQHIENLTLLGSANLDASGNGLDNVLTGNSGNNVLNGGFGADTMIGGLGNDTYKVENAGDMVVENAGEGTDTVQSSISVALYTYGQHIENLTLTGSANIDGSGNGLDNTITGNVGHNVLNGGFGADTMIGGAGSDTYKVENAGDMVVEYAGQGDDTVEASISVALYTYGQHIEKLTLTGSGDIDGTGNGLNNVLIGNSGDNVLNGAYGNDTLIGGGGDDTFEFVGSFGQDRINDFDIAAANEVIDLSALSSITGFTDLETNHMSQVGESTVIDDGSGNTIKLSGITMTDLTADEFLFGAEPPSAVMSPFEAVNAKGIMNLRGNDKGYASIDSILANDAVDAHSTTGIFITDIMMHEHMF